MGKCEYVFVKVKAKRWFEVRQVNDACGNSASCTKAIKILFPRLHVHLQRGSVTVNGSVVTLPFNSEGKLYLFYRKNV